MKKINIIIGIFLSFLLLFCYSFCKNNIFDIFDNFDKKECYIYAYENLNAEKIKSGNYYIYNIDDLKNVNFNMGFADEIVLYNIVSKEEIFAKLNVNFVVKDNVIENNYYAFSPLINNYVGIDGNKINVQIYIGENYIKIGSPLLFGFM